MKELNVYLSGEIHTDWRDQIVSMTENKGLNVQFTGPVTIHENSDDCGVKILGEEATELIIDFIVAIASTEPAAPSK